MANDRMLLVNEGTKEYILLAKWDPAEGWWGWKERGQPWGFDDAPGPDGDNSGPFRIVTEKDEDYRKVVTTYHGTAYAAAHG